MRLATVYLCRLEPGDACAGADDLLGRLKNVASLRWIAHMRARLRPEAAVVPQIKDLAELLVRLARADARAMARAVTRAVARAAACP